MTTETVPCLLRGLKFASIPVGDQDRALAFYTGKLGLAVATDQPMGEGADAPRWIELRIPGADTRLVLFTPEEHRDRVGTFTGLSVWTEDVETAYRIYVERGVEFVGPPAVEPWGTYALLKDPDGNVICLSSR